MQPTFWCQVGLHKWSRWEMTIKGRASRGDYKNVEYEEVRRECRCCGMPEKKVVWSMVK